MPKSKFDSFPVSSFDDFKDRFPLVLEYFRNDFNDTYGLGTDTKGSLDFTDNLADPASLTGTTSNTFTLDADDTGGDMSLIFGTTNNEFLSWIDDDSRFLLSDDLELTGDLLPTTDDTYDIGSTDLSWKNTYLTGSLFFDDTFEFTHDGTDFTLNDSLDITGEFTVSGIINANGGITSDDLTDTAWGIQNQNLLDKTATELLSGLYTWTTNGIVLNDNVPLEIGSAGTGALFSSDGSIIEIDLAIGTIDFNIKTSTINNSLFILESTGQVGIDNAGSFADTLRNLQIGQHTGTGQGFTTISEAGIITATKSVSGITGSVIEITRSRGNIGAKETVNNSDSIFSFDGYAYSSDTAFSLVSQFGMSMDGANNKGKIFFSAGTAGAINTKLQITGEEVEIIRDNYPLKFGATNIGAIDHDGTNMNINPDVVGSGRLLVNNRDVKSMALMVR